MTPLHPDLGIEESKPHGARGLITSHTGKAAGVDDYTLGNRKGPTWPDNPIRICASCRKVTCYQGEPGMVCGVPTASYLLSTPRMQREWRAMNGMEAGE